MKRIVDHRLLTAACIALLLGATPSLAQAPPEKMHDFAPGLAQPNITTIQTLLTERGYRVRVTGAMDYETVNAVRLYQQDAGLPATGRADQALINHLNFGPKVYNPRPAFSARYGRETVRAAQQRLASLGYDPGGVDGVVGPRTRAAVARFRAAQGLPPGGLDDAVLRALNVSGS